MPKRECSSWTKSGHLERDCAAMKEEGEVPEQCKEPARKRLTLAKNQVRASR